LGGNPGRRRGVQGLTPVILVERSEGDGKSLLDEMCELAEAAGYRVVGIVTQVRAPDPRYNIGSGKVKELAQLIKETGARKVIFFNELKPHQAYNLMKELKVEVIDRFDLILEIFAMRAGSREAKLQIELARLRRELSFARERLRLAKLGELHGYMGGGEYAIDVYYKHVRRRISKIEDELAKLRALKGARWERRSIEGGLFYAAITGYTGAGKTTLFRALTGFSGYVDGKPFATLSTKLRRINLNDKPLVVSDTVGFIDSLPPQLLDAFYTTLGEVVLADLILLVYDASEDLSEVQRKLTASLSTLLSLGISKTRILAVANKMDLLADKYVLEKKLEVARSLGLHVVPVSALTGLGLDALKGKMLEMLPNCASAWIKVSSADAVEKLKRQGFVRDVKEREGYLEAFVEGREEWVRRMLERGDGSDACSGLKAGT